MMTSWSSPNHCHISRDDYSFPYFYVVAAVRGIGTISVVPSDLFYPNFLFHLVGVHGVAVNS